MLAFGLAAGALIGLVHFVSLGWNMRLFVTGSALGAAGLQIARLALVAIVFFGLAKIGAGALLAGLVGLLAARRRALRQFGRVR
jgi:F1F0 ATPase subunit 2